jgi:phosphatidylserine decarboxylase
MQSVCAQLPRAAVRTPCSRAPRPAHVRASRLSRNFSTTRPTYEQFNKKESFRSRLNSALKNTKVKWEPIPIALGIGFLGAFQFYRIQRREKHTQSGGDNTEDVLDSHGRPKKRDRIRPSGPW